METKKAIKVGDEIELFVKTYTILDRKETLVFTEVRTNIGEFLHYDVGRIRTTEYGNEELIPSINANCIEQGKLNTNGFFTTRAMNKAESQQVFENACKKDEEAKESRLRHEQRVEANFKAAALRTEKTRDIWQLKEDLHNKVHQLCKDAKNSKEILKSKEIKDLTQEIILLEKLMTIIDRQ